MEQFYIVTFHTFVSGFMSKKTQQIFNFLKILTEERKLLFKYMAKEAIKFYRVSDLVLKN